MNSFCFFLHRALPQHFVISNICRKSMQFVHRIVNASQMLISCLWYCAAQHPDHNKSVPKNAPKIHVCCKPWKIRPLATKHVRSRNVLICILNWWSGMDGTMNNVDIFFCGFSVNELEWMALYWTYYMNFYMRSHKSYYKNDFFFFNKEHKLIYFKLLYKQYLR